MVNRKPYGLENEKLAGNKPRGGMPMVLDDRLISKQYINEKVDAKVDNTTYGSSWNDVTDVAPSKEALWEYLSSLTPSSDMWTKEEDTSDTNVKTYKTGNYGIGKTNWTGADEWAKLDVTGSISATGDFIMATDGSKVGPSSGYLTLHSTNGALLPTKFMIGTGTAGVPLEISLAGDTLGLSDSTGIIQVGAVSSANLGIGTDAIQARAAAVATAAELKLNADGGNITLGNSSSTITVAGSLSVTGTATTLNTTSVSTNDNEIILNSDVTGGTPGPSASITVERGDAANAQITWDESTDKWYASPDEGTTKYYIEHNSHAPMTLGATNTDNALSISGQAISLADKFVQNSGDTMTGPLVIGDATSGAVTNLTVWGEDEITSTSTALSVRGLMTATAKAFNIEHPLKKGMRLVHGCLEGPEFGVYQRGTLKSNLLIEEIALPEWWKVIVGDYTVLLTPHGNYNVWLEEKNKTMFKIKTSADAIDGPWSCEWYAVGRRLDVKLEVEQNANE